MSQARLMLRRERTRDVSDDIIQKQNTLKDALRLTKEVSGLNDQQICQELEIDPAQWSRIWTDKAHFPHDKLTTFMDLCENIIPLRWLALYYGYELKPLKSTVEKENDSLRAENERLQRDLSVIKGFLKEVGLNGK